MSYLPSLVLLGLALLAFRGKVTPIAITVWSLGLTLGGMATLDELMRTSFWVPAATGAVALLAAYVLVAAGRLRTDGVVVHPGTVAPAIGALVLFEIAILALVAMHFIVTGIPLFSPNVEVSRFDFGNSVLFGLPGRAYLFGLPFLVLLSSAYAARFPGTIATRATRIAWVAYIAAHVLMGTKGALLEVLVFLVLVRVTVGRPLAVRDVLGVRVAAWVLAGLAFAIFVAFQYSSIGISDPGDAIAYLQQRATVQGAEPGYIVMSEMADDHRVPYAVDDIAYFVQRYTGLKVAGDTAFPLELIVSARLIGASPEDAAFLAPVTIGAFAGWYADVGWVGAVLAMLLVGALYGLGSTRPAWSASVLRATLWGFTGYILSVYVGNGNAAYWAVNGLALGVLWSMLWLLCRGAAAVLAPRRRRLVHAREFPVPTLEGQANG